MPIYEFRCCNCNEEFEKLVLGKNEVECPFCRGTRVERILSRFGFKSGSTFVGSKGSGCSSCKPSSPSS